MDELIVPSSSSHWSLRLVDTKKPFPNHILANVTYKIARFFYPPFAVGAVDFTHVVSNPELNAFNVGLFLSFSVFLPCFIYAVWLNFLKPNTAARKSTEQQASIKSEAEKNKDTVDPESDDVLTEPNWVTVSKESIFDAALGTGGKEKDNVRCRTNNDLDGDKEDDLAGRIDRAIWGRKNW
ncbi:uncharacterized protein LOC110190336 isoform X2 [Drosophila serrata]|uniref:uncharacterized protein LOC110190336 isoform X2 n=1 Tax=Drosophila serrata TaxID=7274 RepID=UPI000A1D0BED|nr:uncharacterized protein LOC110190336 isoform X2 [Drosophila serrata]